MIARLKISLPQEEYSALLQAGIEEIRNPSDQLRFILRDWLESRGFLPVQPQESTQAQPQEVPCADA